MSGAGVSPDLVSQFKHENHVVLYDGAFDLEATCRRHNCLVGAVDILNHLHHKPRATLSVGGPREGYELIDSLGLKTLTYLERACNYDSFSHAKQGYSVLSLAVLDAIYHSGPMVLPMLSDSGKVEFLVAIGYSLKKQEFYLKAPGNIDKNEFYAVNFTWHHVTRMHFLDGRIQRGAVNTSAFFWLIGDLVPMVHKETPVPAVSERVWRFDRFTTAMAVKHFKSIQSRSAAKDVKPSDWPALPSSCFRLTSSGELEGAAEPGL